MTYLEAAEHYAQAWLDWRGNYIMYEAGAVEPPMPDMERIWALHQFARAPMVARMKMRKAGVTDTMTQYMNWMAGVEP